MNIYYFSGTGQSWQIAHWIAEIFQRQEKDVHLAALEHSAAQQQTGDDFPLILVYPVYGFALPWLLFKWILKLPFGRGRCALLFNTRGAIKLGPFLIGINGLALWLPAFILRCKGYHIKCLAAFDLASNWVTAHPGPSRASAEKMMAVAKEELLQLMTKVSCDKLVVHKRVWWTMLPDIFTGIFIGLPYLFYWRIFLAKLFLASPACNLCGQCARRCPTGSIVFKPSPYWRTSCVSCMRCLNSCPQKAIYTAHLPILLFIGAGLVCLYYWGFSLIGLAAAFLGPVLLAVIFYPIFFLLAAHYNIGSYISLSVNWPYYSWRKNSEDH